MACLHRARSSLSSVVELFEQADRDVVRRTPSVLGGLPSLERCADLEALETEVPLPTDPDVLRELEQSQAELADLVALGAAGKHDEALPRLVELSERAKQIPYAPFLAEVTFVHGEALRRTGRDDEAEPMLREAAALAVESGPGKVAVFATYTLATLLARASRNEEARWLAWMSIGLARRYDTGGPLEATAREGMAAVHLPAGEYAEARSVLETSVELLESAETPNPAALANTLSNLGVSLEALGELKEAEPVQRRALALFQEERGEMHPRAAQFHERLARVLGRLDRADEAETQMLRSIEIQETFFGSSDPRLAQPYDSLGQIYQRQGDFDRALDMHRRAYDLSRSTANRASQTVTIALNMVSALEHLGREDEALALLMSTREPAEKAVGAEHPLLGNLHLLRAGLLASKGEWAEAEGEARHAVAIFEPIYGSKHVSVIDARVRIGMSLVEMSNHAEAIPILERALEDAKDAQATADRPYLARALLARALEASGSTDDARIETLAREARDWYGDDDNPRFAKVIADLDALLSPSTG